MFDSKYCIADQTAALLFQAEGYTDGDLTLYHSFTVTNFLKADNPIDFLSKASEVRSLYFFYFSVKYKLLLYGRKVKVKSMKNCPGPWLVD